MAEGEIVEGQPEPRVVDARQCLTGGERPKTRDMEWRSASSLSETILWRATLEGTCDAEKRDRDAIRVFAHDLGR
jgi:hypothetical protein